MQQIMEQALDLAPSLCDAEGLLGVPAAFRVFMDAAGTHAERLGIGLAAMRERALFWLTVRTRIVFHERPAMGETVTLRTWPEKPGALRCNRSYTLSRGEKTLLRARTEWAVLHTGTGALTPAAGLFPAELAFDLPSACPEPFARIPDRFGDAEPFAEYRVRSTDIDVGGHMNNAAYLRALFGAFPNAELAALPIRTVDAHFRAACFEGETLRFFRRGEEGLLDLRAARDGQTALLVRIGLAAED